MHYLIQFSKQHEEEVFTITKTSLELMSSVELLGKHDTYGLPYRNVGKFIDLRFQLLCVENVKSHILTSHRKYDSIKTHTG